MLANLDTQDCVPIYSFYKMGQPGLFLLIFVLFQTQILLNKL